MSSAAPVSTAAAAAAAPVLPQGIEIFRAGRHIDDAGVAHAFSDADVRGMAAAYRPDQREAPLCVGHPEHDRPAYGYVKGLSVNAAGRLVMDTHQVEPQFAQLVRAGRYKKRSASFYPPAHPNNPAPGHWYLRHVAFLGAQPPAVSGLKDIAFAQGEAGLVAFSEGQPGGADPLADPLAAPASISAPVASSVPSPTPSKESLPMPDTPAAAAAAQAELERKLQAATDEAAAAKAQLAAVTAERDAATAQNASFAEQRKAERTATFTAFAEARLKTGAFKPKDKALMVAALSALADVQPVEFAEGDATRKVALASWLQDVLSAARPPVSFGEFVAGAGADLAPGSAQGHSDADIHQAASDYARQHKCSYAEGLGAVTAAAFNV